MSLFIHVVPINAFFIHLQHEKRLEVVAYKILPPQPEGMGCGERQEQLVSAVFKEQTK